MWHHKGLRSWYTLFNSPFKSGNNRLYGAEWDNGPAVMSLRCDYRKVDFEDQEVGRHISSTENPWIMPEKMQCHWWSVPVDILGVNSGSLSLTAIVSKWVDGLLQVHTTKCVDVPPLQQHEKEIPQAKNHWPERRGDGLGPELWTWSQFHHRSERQAEGVLRQFTSALSQCQG